MNSFTANHQAWVTGDPIVVNGHWMYYRQAKACLCNSSARHSCRYVLFHLIDQLPVFSDFSGDIFFLMYSSGVCFLLVGDFFLGDIFHGYFFRGDFLPMTACIIQTVNLF
jgi:hypothetical protein